MQRDPRGVTAAADCRRTVCGCALAGLLGIRTATETSTGDGSMLRVSHAQVTRAGVAVPFHVEVDRPGGFDGAIRLAVSAELLERFDFQNFYPNPSKETSDGRFLVYEFDPPTGDRFRVSLDARTAPDQNGSWGRYQVRLMDGTAVTARVRFRMLVVP